MKITLTNQAAPERHPASLYVEPSLGNPGCVYFDTIGLAGHLSLADAVAVRDAFSAVIEDVGRRRVTVEVPVAVLDEVKALGGHVV